MGTSSNNYSTYIKGTSQDINDCLTILLFNQKDPILNGLPKLGLNNIDEYYNKLISDKIDYIMVCSRETPTVPFRYEYSTERLIDGFDTIMYLRSLSFKPLGYTTYSVNQGVNISTNISINIKNRVFNSKNQELELNNSIKLIIESSIIKKNFIGEKSYEYTSCQSVIKDLISLRDSDKFYRYSPYVSAVKDSKYGECNLLDFGFVNSSKVYKIDIIRNLKYNPFQINYTNHKISSWEKDDIVIASWVDDKYSIHSLVKRNKFNDPISYTPTPKGYKVIPIPENITGEIIEIVGRFAKIKLVDSSGDDREAIFDVITDSWVKTDKSSIKILDPISSIGLVELPGKVDGSYLSTVRKKLPGITDIHYKLVAGDLVIGKVGNWYIIKPVLDLINEGTLIYTTTSKTIVVSEKEEVLVVNDKILATKSNIGSEIYYYFYIADEGYKYDLKDGGDTRYMYWSELAKHTVFPGHNFERTLTGHPIYHTGNEDEYNSYQNLYKNRAIKVVKVGENILGCKNISGFRRNIIDLECLQIPEFLGAFMGLLFYEKENNYLNYL